MLGGIIVSLTSPPGRAFRNLVWLSCGPKSGCAERYLRGAGADLRYAGDLFIALLIAVPVSFGIALFLTGLRLAG